MRAIWMGISPGPLDPRILVQDGPEQTLLKARMPRQWRVLRPTSSPALHQPSVAPGATGVAWPCSEGSSGRRELGAE